MEFYHEDNFYNQKSKFYYKLLSTSIVTENIPVSQFLLTNGWNPSEIVILGDTEQKIFDLVLQTDNVELLRVFIEFFEHTFKIEDISDKPNAIEYFKLYFEKVWPQHSNRFSSIYHIFKWTRWPLELTQLADPYLLEAITSNLGKAHCELKDMMHYGNDEFILWVMDHIKIPVDVFARFTQSTTFPKFESIASEFIEKYLTSEVYNELITNKWTSKQFLNTWPDIPMTKPALIQASE